MLIEFIYDPENDIAFKVYLRRHENFFLFLEMIYIEWNKDTKSQVNIKFSDCQKNTIFL